MQTCSGWTSSIRSSLNYSMPKFGNAYKFFIISKDINTYDKKYWTLSYCCIPLYKFSSNNFSSR